MTIDPQFLIPVAVVLGANLLVMSILLFLVSIFFKRFFISREGFVREKREAEKLAWEITSKAEYGAKDIILKARQEAAQILEKTEIFKNGLEKNLENSFRSFVEREGTRVGKLGEQFSEYQRSLLEELGKKQVAIIDSAGRNVNSQIENLVSDLQKSFSKEMEKYRESLNSRVEEEFQEAKKQAQIYREDLVKKTEAAIYRIVTLTSKQVLGKIISLEDQQSLVLQALEEAKKDNFFGQNP